jgi:O-antigen/teichoic acid export membrane protein
MKNRIENLQSIFKNISDKGFFHLLSANVLIQVVAFGSQLFVAGILAPEDIGRIKIIQTYLSIFSIVAGMGFNASTLKICSENRPFKEQETLFKSALYFTLVSTISFYIIVLILNYFNLFTTDKLIKWLLPFGLFPIISNSLFMVFVSYFQATKKIRLMSNFTISNKIISIISIIILTYWLGIKGYYIAYNLSFVFVLIICFRLFSSTFSNKQTLSILKTDLPIHWKYAKPSLFANLLSETSAYLDILLITFFIHDMHSIGFYSFALTLTITLRIIPSTVQQIATPYFSTLVYDKYEFIRTFNKYNKILLLVVVVTLILAWILASPLIHFIFNGKFDASIPFFLILSVGWSIRNLNQLQSGAIFGLGKIKYNAYISLISLIFNIVIYSFSLYFYGLMGIAYASIPSGIMTYLASRYYFQKAKSQII